MIIFVGSENPVKVNAVILAASETWPEVEVHGLSVPSGISKQPRTNEEAKQGAENRALKALEDGLNLIKNKKNNLNITNEILSVGLEGGVFTEKDGSLWNTVWAAVCDTQGYLSAVNGLRFEIKDPIASEIRAGNEMGPAISKMTGIGEINRQQGMIGIVTNGFSDRTEEYAGLAKLALGLWYGRNWYDSIRSTTQLVKE